jgi:hypothetical protein
MAARLGCPREVDAQAVGRAQPRTFADQHDDDAAVEQGADVVADRDAALFDDGNRSNRPV